MFWLLDRFSFCCVYVLCSMFNFKFNCWFFQIITIITYLFECSAFGNFFPATSRLQMNRTGEEDKKKCKSSRLFIKWIQCKQLMKNIFNEDGTKTFCFHLSVSVSLITESHKRKTTPTTANKPTKSKYIF